MPEDLKWKKINVNGEVPEPRMGHSLLKVDWNYLLFGGLKVNDTQTGLEPSNDVYCIKISGKTPTWNKIDTQGDIPLPRAYHSSC